MPSFLDAMYVWQSKLGSWAYSVCSLLLPNRSFNTCPRTRSSLPSKSHSIKTLSFLATRHSLTPPLRGRFRRLGSTLLTLPVSRKGQNPGCSTQYLLLFSVGTNVPHNDLIPVPSPHFWRSGSPHDLKVVLSVLTVFLGVRGASRPRAEKSAATACLKAVVFML